jgi:riboflavin synthase alpha subunit
MERHMEFTDIQKQKLRDAVNKAGDAMDRVAERFRQRKAESEKSKKK